MLGTTVVYSTGDDGVAGFNDACLDVNGMCVIVSFVHCRFGIKCYLQTMKLARVAQPSIPNSR